jgi:hypothetical protein
MAEPPKRGDRGEDFRTVSGTVSARDNGTLDALLCDVGARQQMLRQVLEDEEEARMLPFVGSARIEHGAKTVAASLRAALEVTNEQQKRKRGPRGLFTLLRSSVERIGVYVLLLGDVGSHHSGIGEDVFREFALANDVAPFIVVDDNDADAKTVRTFTLMCELGPILDRCCVPPTTQRPKLYKIDRPSRRRDAKGRTEVSTQNLISDPPFDVQRLLQHLP